jgi:hypothetical protein
MIDSQKLEEVKKLVESFIKQSTIEINEILESGEVYIDAAEELNSLYTILSVSKQVLGIINK